MSLAWVSVSSNRVVQAMHCGSGPLPLTSGRWHSSQASLMPEPTSGPVLFGHCATQPPPKLNGAAGVLQLQIRSPGLVVVSRSKTLGEAQVI